MSKLTSITKIYILITILVGIALIVWFFKDLHTDITSLVMLLFLLILSSMAQVVKVEGTTNRSHYAVSFVVYTFTLFQLGLIETMLVILVSYFAEWLWRSPAWYISVFNSASLVIVSSIAFFVYKLLNPGGDLLGWQSVLAIIIMMIVFTLLNHLMVGVIVWMARGENFVQSGIFDFLPLMIDMTLLLMGGSFFLLWNFNSYAILLYLAPIYLLYNTLRVPALERQTELDSKTNLYNHTYFMKQLENELARAQRFERPLSVLMADLDLLRNVNNTYGHLAGDEILLAIAKILQTSVRDYDLVARFGGEEFSVLMPETSTQIAFERAEKIRRAIETAEFTISTSMTPIKVTMSIGVAGRIKLNESKEEIIHNADTVLYYAKLKGRNCTVIYSEDMNSLVAGQVDPDSPDEHAPHNHAPIPARSAAANVQTTQPVIRNSDVNEIHPNGNAREILEKTPSVESTAEVKTHAEVRSIQRRTYLFIGGLVVCAALLFVLFRQPFDIANIWKLSLFVLVLIFTEAHSTEIYVRDTAVSTSAAPFVAGALLFGPVGALVLSMVFALTSYLKYKGPKNRILFNAANQLIPALIFLGSINASGITFHQKQPIIELLITVSCMAVLFIFTTCMVSIGISLNSGVKFRKVWIDQFSWLAPSYLAMGVMAYSLIFGFVQAGILGLIVIIFPLMMVRMGQIQYIERTRSVVAELREKNSGLERSSSEILRINDGLLETLADLIDLRDPYVLGHSQQVTRHAELIAKKLGFEEQRIQMLHKACLLHDLGKLGIPENILAKPGSLTEHEYSLMKNHAAVGASLLSKNPSLKSLSSTVRHHHERYDGLGYPDGLRGNQIPLEARIVAVADAIDAMSSNRVYRPALSRDAIIAELKNNAGIQFDPQIIEIAIGLLESKKLLIGNSNNQK